MNDILEGTNDMSNPLAHLRNNSKILLVVFVVLLMMAFLVEGVVSSRWTADGGGGGRESLVVSFEGAKLNEVQMVALYRADAAANNLLRKVYMATFEAKRTPREFPRPEQSYSENDLVQKLIIAKKARQHGLSMSDEDINAMLKEMSDGAVTDKDLEKLKQQSLGDTNNTVSEKSLYAQLRVNLLAQEYITMLRGGTQQSMMSPRGMKMSITPVQAWDYYRRVNRKVKLELLPLKVEEFVSDVKESPTSAQIADLYEKYKNTQPDPNSPTPGFMKPYRISFGYVKVDFQKFQDAAKVNITEEQLQAEYARRLDRGEFVVPDLPPEKDPTTDPKKEDAPKDKPVEEGKSTDTKPTDEKPTETKPEEKKVDEKAATNEDELINDEGAEPAAKEAAAKTEEPKNADPKTEAPKKDAAEPEAKKDVEKTEAAAPAKEGEKPAETPKEKTRIKTFEEVKEDLRTQLAREPAEEARKAALKDLDEALLALAEKYREWEIASKEKNGKPGEMPDSTKALAEVRKKHGFEVQTLPMFDRFQIAEEELGQSFYIAGQQGQQYPFPLVAYGRDLKLFQADSALGNFTGTDFVYWKEAEEKAEVRPLKDAEADIITAWKLQKAYALAKTEAKNLQTKLASKTVRETFPEGVAKAGAIVETEMFSWLTTGVLPMNVSPRLEISQIKEVRAPGPEFMETMHNLAVGESAVAGDLPNKHVYVMRVIEELPGEEELRQRFMIQGIAMNPAVAMQYRQEREQAMYSVITDAEKELKLTWFREARPFER